MNMKEHIRFMRLKNLEEQLNKMDFTTEEVNLEGVVFNMGKLLLEYIKETGEGWKAVRGRCIFT